VQSVRDALSRTKALIFAREQVSFEAIRSLCHADIAHDCAFFFDFRAYRRSRRHSHGLLRAYRTDREAPGSPVPDGNNDISVTCESLDHWLWTISRYETVQTDRAHVMIAAALLGKHVQYRASSYHKVPAIAEFALRGFPVSRQQDEC
jgi:exopolysaccharide biosynthesis predicted pyruvyltransferase EpsI